MVLLHATGPAQLRFALSFIRMPQPTINHSLEEIREGITREIGWLENVIAKHPRWDWPLPVLVLAREFETLASKETFELARIRDFTNRLRGHVITHRLKGFEPFIWYAEALEHLAEMQP